MGRHSSRGQFYLNREIAQLDFNARVLALAEDRKLPLLERLWFLCIVDSNLDEFFEIRVAGLKEKIAGEAPAGPDGMLPKQVFQQVSQRAHDLVAKQYKLLNEDLLERLAAQGIRFLQHERWNREQKEWLRDYFFREVMPVLTPIGLDPAHPFPRLQNKSLSFCDRAFRQGRVRPQRQHGDRAGAACAAGG